MRIDVRFRGMQASEALRRHIERRVQRRLGRFEQALGSVRVCMEDVNGPKGGVDKRCLVTLRGPTLGSLTLEESSTDAYGAASRAFARAEQALGRGLARLSAGRRLARARPGARRRSAEVRGNPRPAVRA